MQASGVIRLDALSKIIINITSTVEAFCNKSARSAELQNWLIGPVLILALAIVSVRSNSRVQPSALNDHIYLNFNKVALNAFDIPLAHHNPRRLEGEW